MADAENAKQFPDECDLIMKGGITSGVVYPRAIVELAKAFRLRSIGGTSAGAIAAAAAAAAELGRQRRLGGPPAGARQDFDHLEELPRHLGTAATRGKGTKLLAMFQPAHRLAPVFDTFIAALRGRGWLQRIALAALCLVRREWYWALPGALITTFPVWHPWLAGAGTHPVPIEVLQIVWLLAAAALGALLAPLGYLTYLFVSQLPRHNYGVCSGMPGAGGFEGDEALMPWLSRYLDDLAGQSQAFPPARGSSKPTKPLTFGDLAAQKIHLEVMTTCLTLGRPYRLPLLNDEGATGHCFFYDEAEFRRYFPAHVVDHMVVHEAALPSPGDGCAFEGADLSGLRRLPGVADLPVLVAVRMSLSFPILLSAIRLYTFDMGPQARQRRKAANSTRPFQALRPEACWFTDGGISSNFPIHFFDAALPSRPTFGIDLGQAEPETPDSERVVFPHSDQDLRLRDWRRFDQGKKSRLAQIGSLLGHMLSVGRSWNQEALADMPGYRDRIALVRLTDEEGGLNLTMDQSRIDKLSAFGLQVGREFARRFGNSMRSHGTVPAPHMNWESHQLIRLRLLLTGIAGLNAGLLNTQRLLAPHPAMSYQRFFAVSPYGPVQYRLAHRPATHSPGIGGAWLTQADLAQCLLKALTSMAEDIERSSLQAGPLPGNALNNAPQHPSQGSLRPAPELRLQPRT